MRARNPLRRAGRKSRNTAWQRLSQRVRHEHGPVCDRCGKTFDFEDLHGHHVLEPTEYPEAALLPDNIIVLCKDCHRHQPDTLFRGYAAQFYGSLQSAAKKKVTDILERTGHPTLRQLAAAIQAGPLFTETFWVNPLTKRTENEGQ